MRKLLVAISFFTRIKLNLKDVSQDEFYNSMLLMPVVGLLIGLWLWLIAWATHFLRVPAVGAVICILAYLWITGGLHLDGVADTTDGLMSARDRKRVMEIMKDSRLGSMGAIALIMLFLTSFAGYETILDSMPALVALAPVIGRYCGIQNCCFSTYAEGGGGLGKRIVEMTKGWHVAVYWILIAVCGLLLLGPVSLIGFAFAIIIAVYINYKVKAGIGGMTGDTIGLTIEVTQAAYLVAAGVAAVNFPALCGGWIWSFPAIF